ELIRHIASLPKEINLAAKSYDPAKITKYTIDLATLFHRFYDACSVKNAESKELMNARILLCIAVRQVLRNALTILNVTQPEKM
ncbi:MAG: arginine--tRNA ligase, partial [Ruminococcus sp.]|nr:arginine--tRNA ligase [Ruminococcus sp.]